MTDFPPSEEPQPDPPTDTVASANARPDGDGEDQSLLDASPFESPDEAPAVTAQEPHPTSSSDFTDEAPAVTAQEPHPTSSSDFTDEAPAVTAQEPHPTSPSDFTDEQLIEAASTESVLSTGATELDETIDTAHGDLTAGPHGAPTDVTDGLAETGELTNAMASSADEFAEGTGDQFEPPPPGFSGAAASAGAGSASSGGTPPPTPPLPPSGYGPGPGGPGYGPPSAVRRIYRSRHDRKLGGVSAGIAEYFRIDPTIVRIVTLLFAISGVGILVYLAAWLIIPMRPEGLVESPPQASPVNERTMTIAFGIAALALAIGIASGSWAVLAVALIGGGVWLLSEQTTVAPTAMAPSSYAPPPPYQPAAYAGPQAATGAPHGYAQPSADASPPPAAPTWTPPAVKERKPQRITWIVLSLLALLAAVGIAAGTGDWWDVSATRFVGVGVIIIGVGVVLGQLRGGGARGLIPLGLLAALALFPISAIDGLLDDGVGEATYRPTSIADLETSYQHGIGKLVVDLSDVDFSDRNEDIDIDLGIGELIVIVSDETGGQAVLQATAGEISHMMPRTNSTLFEEGINIETGTVRLAGDNGMVDLNINVGLGTAELRRDSN